MGTLQCDQAAQLMPPPRLPRHLRPCHPSGTAFQARYAHKTARTAFLTDGDETPQCTTGKSSDESFNAPHDPNVPNTNTPIGRESLWNVAIGKIASLISEPTSTEPNSPAADTPSASAPKPIKDEQHSPAQSVPKIGQGLVRRLVVSDEKSQKQPQRFKARSKQTEAEADGQDDSKATIRRVLTRSDSPISTSVLFSEGQQCHIAEHGGAKADKLVAIELEPALKPLKEEVRSIQQEIQRLSGDVRALQVALEAKFMAESAMSVTGGDIASTEPTMSSVKRQSAVAPAPLAAVDIAASASDSRAPREQSTLSPTEQRHNVHQIYQAAWTTHKRWMSILGKTAEYLVDMPPRAVARLASLVLRDIRTIEKDTTRNEDTGQIAQFSHPHRRAARSLATILVPRNLSDALLAGESTYRNSTSELCDVANSLNDIQSPLLESIVTFVRNRLRVIVENAILKDDIRMFNVMETYRDLNSLYAETGHSPILTHQPGLVLRLEKILARRKIQEFHRSMGFLKKDVSRISSELTRKPAEHTDAGTSRTKIKKAASKQTVSDGEKSDVTEVFKAVPERTASHTINPNIQSQDHPDNQVKNAKSADSVTAPKKNDGSGLVDQAHKRSRSIQSSDNPRSKHRDNGNAPSFSPKQTKSTGELTEQSLLDELFPEANTTPPPAYKEERDHPKVEPPTARIIHTPSVDRAPTFKEKVIESFQKQGEQVAVLQLTNCSTQLTETDFRRVIPKGKHIEGWRRDGDFYKVIPGRDPLSLERLPFYYLLFKTAEAALAYQKNVSRLHKLSALHQPASIFSAIPPPMGFLEEGEDIKTAISSYNLLPTHHPLSLNMLMQPYNPALRALIERGGYQPIASSVDRGGRPIWRVLMHIEGYEPRPSDLFKIFSHDAYTHGMTLPLRNESQSSIHRVRDMINLRMSSKLVSSARPRAYGTFDHSKLPLAEPTHEMMTFDDPAIQNLMAGADEDGSAQQMNQLVMNRVYNRWVIDFEDEDSARRWCAIWHRKVLPDLSDRKGGWKDTEEERVCNTEVLW
ncbi:hypothetical protein GMOD_00006868 [Pyrenophora seminiperda CCB06]|uniref:Uncharacterized protein n=1 Tax=Pyrenophora seminiperda CCB06 TaxID=1302712 RepID=A0A3M7MBI2_9PLEO|nr:hypothetical protein GMOD_00006868 [Pyrenophora seminiperda CCB06]